MPTQVRAWELMQLHPSKQLPATPEKPKSLQPSKNLTSCHNEAT